MLKGWIFFIIQWFKSPIYPKTECQKAFWSFCLLMFSLLECSHFIKIIFFTGNNINLMAFLIFSLFLNCPKTTVVWKSNLKNGWRLCCLVFPQKFHECVPNHYTYDLPLLVMKSPLIMLKFLRAISHPDVLAC